jgi:penicillin-binding protein 1A
MRVALDGVEEILPEQPPGMITMRIDVDTGKPVGIEQKNTIFEVFREDHAPSPATSSISTVGNSSETSKTIDPAEDPF